TGFGQYLFFDWRFLENGDPNPEFALNQPAAKGATILVARRNFGSGSSREHAVWALSDYGFRTVLAPSFADIFYNNCFKNGVLPVALPEDVIETIFQRAATVADYQVTVNLESLQVTDNQGLSEAFTVDPARRDRMLKGQDDIATTLQHVDKILAYEQAHGIA
ncbi:MAG: 3-isopropylmalate dehydratase small subunit, partial [Nitratireductor sp.]|nr:3-isopropylmalate dehydratase small subunit [Nitratireductor sp.]